MKTPTALQALIDDGVIDGVLRPLKSGKEAAVYVVRSGFEVRWKRASPEFCSSEPSA
jgi:RIO kinase 1